MLHALTVGANCHADEVTDEKTEPRRDYFTIEVIDDQTKRGVPLVELRTTSGLRYVTDSSGLVAFHEPGLMDRPGFFHVSSHGYEFPKDGFGFRGRTLRVKPGGSAQLAVRRVNIAQRLYRVTGAGIYRDTVLLGRKAPIKEPLLNAEVTGSDSVVSAVYRDRLYWFWGDTNRVRYPLGNFHVPGAVSKLPADGGLDPAVGVDLEYFRDEQGFARSMAKMEGDGPTWITGLTVVPDAAEKERMIASYMKVRGLLSVYRRGLVQFNDVSERFEHVVDVPLDAPMFSHGHPLMHREVGSEYVYYCDPLPLTRVPARAESVLDLRQYETFTCLRPGTVLPADKKVTREVVDRDDAGRPRWAWKKNTSRVTPGMEKAMVSSGLIDAEQARLLLKSTDGGKTVVLHSGSVAWNDYRRRWVLVGLEIGGTSLLGEVWYSEADALEGPWQPATKIVTHDRYSFYNPKQHPNFAKEGGRIIFFEGTYSHSFTDNQNPTPLYDYNQVMYQLDLADPRLGLTLRHARDDSRRR